MLREFLEKNIREEIRGVEDKDIALLFSGGTDSSCILFSLLDLGIKPALYIYVVQGAMSEDWKRARIASDKFGLKLTVCVIPYDTEALIRDIKRLIKCGVEGKVNTQCMHGNLYMLEKIKEKLAFNGSGVDGLYGTYRDMAIIAKDGVLFMKKQLEHLRNENDDGMAYLRQFYHKEGIRIAFPYREGNITRYLVGKTYGEMNRPRLKWIIVKEYQDYYKQLGKYYSPRGSQQLISGVRTFHDKLINSRVNTKNRKSVAWIYKDMKEENEQ